ncbi:hypothetical protein [Ideonella paludis]|uniref:DUF1376 domain-containing protein n=1 Tax=Ideonella paludis TaxID=1233411 RepID=A0ABS5DU44_9BURK|nr:hypothetical protein [Ideonella paludis]MBQ0934652.1 hypothetical protein [Ideonella paludis]
MLWRQHPGVIAGGSAGGGQPIELIDWDGIFAHVIARLGWTWDVAEQQLDLHRLRALTQEWEQCPPVHTLVAAYLGYKPPQVSQSATQEQVQPLLSAMPTRENAPKVDDSAWLAALADIEPKAPEHE